MKHWLLIDGLKVGKDTKKQWENLKTFLDTYPESKITIYNKTEGSIFDKVVCLESSQSYKDLDLDCNSSFSASLKRFDRKPNNLEEAPPFEKLYPIYTRAS